jgi:hypothetical protein
MFDVVVVGAGASGLMLGALAPSSFRIAFVESNPKIGMKILVSGGGKCNLTNRCVTPEDYLGDPAFIAPSLDTFGSSQTLDFFHEVALEERDRGKLFGKNSAKDVVRVLEKKNAHHRFFLSQQCQEVRKHEGIFEVKTDKGSLACKRLVVASGGLSWPAVGASDIGHQIARSVGHHIVPCAPALVGLTVQKEQFWMKELSGISFPVRVTCKERVCEGELLFSHKGISGPVVMDVSLFWSKGAICVDFLPQHRVDALLASGSHKRLSTLIPLPKRFVKSFLEAIGVEDKPCALLGKEEKEAVRLLHGYVFAPAGTVGFSKAEATKGGVCTTEINPYTMESLVCENLYFLGEVLDVTGKLGGYNLQWAFASAAQCAQSLA